ncbi:MAG: hypothetical protein AB1791_15405, partial [Chloroflexota bacterium]
MSNDWTIRAYAPGDEAQLVELFARTFGRPISETHWRWKAKGFAAPFESAWVAAAGGRIVGHYATMPARLCLV